MDACPENSISNPPRKQNLPTTLTERKSLYYQTSEIVPKFGGQMRYRLKFLIGTVLCLVTASVMFTSSLKLKARAENITYGGTVSIGWTDDPETLNPTWGTYNTKAMVTGLVMDHLLVYYPNMTIAFRLLQSYEMSSDGMSCNVHMRDNAFWHDGKPVTCEDLEFTCKYAVEHGLGYQSVANWKLVDHFEILDEKNCTIHMKEPIRDTFGAGRIRWLLPKHIWENIPNPLTYEGKPSEVLMGAGPYKIVEWKILDYIIIEANENYWGGRPYVDRIIFKIFPSLDSEIMALKAGEIDAIFPETSLPSSVVPSLVQEEDIRITIGNATKVIQLQINLNSTNPFTKDLRVRQAMAHAIDKKTLVDVFEAGYGAVADIFVPPNIPVPRSPNLITYEFNLTKAAEILTDSGYIDRNDDGIRESETGKPMVFNFAAYGKIPTFMRATEMVAGWFEEIGIKVKVNALETASMYALCWPPSPEYEMSLDYWTAFIPEYAYHGSLYLSYMIQEGENCFSYVNPEFDAAYEDWLTQRDLQKKLADEWKMQELINRDLPCIPLWYPYIIQAHRTDKFGGWVDNMSGGCLHPQHYWSLLQIYSLSEGPSPGPTIPVEYLVVVVIASIVIVGIGIVAYRAKKRRGKI